MDEYLEQMLIDCKLRDRKCKVGIESAAKELYSDSLNLTQEERKRFSNLSFNRIIQDMKIKYDISLWIIDALVYPDGLVYLIDNDGREYRDTLESLGYKLIDGAYIKND